MTTRRRTTIFYFYALPLSLLALASMTPAGAASTQATCTGQFFSSFQGQPTAVSQLVQPLAQAGTLGATVSADASTDCGTRG